jgi:hypothetical protein
MWRSSRPPFAPARYGLSGCRSSNARTGEEGWRVEVSAATVALIAVLVVLVIVQAVVRRWR